MDNVTQHKNFLAAPNLTNPWSPDKGIDFESPATRFWVTNKVKDRLQKARQEKSKIGGWLILPGAHATADWTPAFAISSGFNSSLKNLLPYVTDIQVFEGVHYVQTEVIQHCEPGKHSDVTYSIRGTVDMLPQKQAIWAIGLCSIPATSIPAAITIHGYSDKDVADLDDMEIHLERKHTVMINTDADVHKPCHLRNVLFGGAADEQSSAMSRAYPGFRSFPLGQVYGKEEQEYRTHVVHLTDEQLEKVKEELASLKHITLDPKKKLYSIEHRPKWHQDKSKRGLKQTAESVLDDVMEDHRGHITNAIMQTKWTIIVELQEEAAAPILADTIWRTHNYSTTTMETGKRVYAPKTNGPNGPLIQVPAPYCKCTAPIGVDKSQINKVAATIGNVKDVMTFSTNPTEDTYIVLFEEKEAAEAITGMRVRAGTSAVHFGTGNPIKDMEIRRSTCNAINCQCDSMKQCFDMRKHKATNYKGEPKLTVGNLEAHVAAMKECKQLGNFRPIRKIVADSEPPKIVEVEDDVPLLNILSPSDNPPETTHKEDTTTTSHNKAGDTSKKGTKTPLEQYDGKDPATKSARMSLTHSPRGSQTAGPSHTQTTLNFTGACQAQGLTGQ